MANDELIRMDLRTRRTVAILLLVSLAAEIVLSSSLANLRLGPGDPFPGASSQSSQTETGVAARRLPAGETLPVFRGLLAVSLLVLGALLVKRLSSVTSLKHLFGLLVAMAASQRVAPSSFRARQPPHVHNPRTSKHLPSARLLRRSSGLQVFWCWPVQPSH
jgi:hypothetical protein